MLDPIFDLLAGLLAWFYSLVPSYGFAITALTTLVLLVLSPLTYRSTKSMVAMRQLQPQVKRLQKKHKGDREKLNQAMMALYQEHNVSPLSGCLPILVQSPVFIVMFRVIRGVTRRSADTGYEAGQSVSEFLSATNLGTEAATNVFSGPDASRRTFNPEYLNHDSDMYQDLIHDNEMLFAGVDLARTPLEVIQDSIGSSLPYIAMVVLVAFLSWFQQRQIQGRMTGEVSSQQQMIMKFLPWMLPIFSFTMPAGLVLYFIVSALLRIAQQGYITRKVYGNEELTKELEFDTDDDDLDDDDDDDDGEPENPLAALFGGGANAKAKTATPEARHGSRRPTSGTSGTRSRPARSSNNGSTATKSSTASKKKPAAKSEPAEKVSGWGRAKRSAPQTSEMPEKPASRRVTPKGDSAANRRGKK